MRQKILANSTASHWQVPADRGVTSNSPNLHLVSKTLNRRFCLQYFLHSSTQTKAQVNLFGFLLLELYNHLFIIVLTGY